MTAIGGETSGWAVVLDNPLRLGGKMLKRLELDPAGRKLDKFKDKHLDYRNPCKHAPGMKEEDTGFWWLKIFGVVDLNRDGAQGAPYTADNDRGEHKVRPYPKGSIASRAALEYFQI